MYVPSTRNCHLVMKLISGEPHVSISVMLHTYTALNVLVYYMENDIRLSVRLMSASPLNHVPIRQSLGKVYI